MRAYLHTRKCEVCGKSFRTNYSKKKFCSNKCYLASRKIASKKRIAARKKPEAYRECIECGKTFKMVTSWHQTCSEACREKRNNRKRQEAEAKRRDKERAEQAEYKKNIAKKKPTKDIIPCNRCNKPFRSWDTTKNRRCPACQLEIENLSIGVPLDYLERLQGYDI